MASMKKGLLASVVKENTRFSVYYICQVFKNECSKKGIKTTLQHYLCDKNKSLMGPFK